MFSYKIRLLLIFFTLFGFNKLNAQKKIVKLDTVEIKDLSFLNSNEEALFFQLKENKGDLLQLIMSIDSNYKEIEYTKFCNNIDLFLAPYVNRSQELKKQKNMEKFFDKTHKKYLHKYEYNPVFRSMIDSNGKYNCVTASILYAALFDRINVDYTVRELPTHVYLMAFPKSEQFIVETTDPISGIESPSPRSKGNYVKYLLKAEQIDQEELDAKGVDSLFEEHYFQSEIKSTRELAAMYYNNLGYSFALKENHKAASEYYKKAYVLEPSPSYKLNLVNAWFRLVKNNPMEEKVEIGYYLRGIEFCLPELQKNTIADFAKLSSRMIEVKNDSSLYRQTFEMFWAADIDSSVKVEIARIYYQQSCRMYVMFRDYQNSALSILMALKTDPENVFLRTLGLEIMYKLISDCRTDSIYETKIRSILGSDSTLVELTLMKRMTGVLHLWRAENAYKENELFEGDQSLNEFEALKIPLSEWELVESRYIARAYGEGWRAYVRDRKETQAFKYIERGLKFDAQNEDLLRYKSYH